MAELPATTPLTCNHARTEVRRFVKSNGVTVAARQCLDCGANRGEVPKASVNFAVLIEFDHDLRERRDRDLRELHRAWRDQEAADRNAAWGAEYERVINSPEWKDLKRRWIRLYGDICRACGERPGHDLHHYPWGYKRLGREKLIDVVLVCRQCHEDIHEKRIGGGDDF